MNLGNVEGEKGARRRSQTYECQLHSATEACSRRFTFFGPAVIGEAGQRNIGFGFVGGGGHDCVLLYGC